MSLALEDYLQRIGWTGDRRPTRDNLAGLLRQHMIAVPFENLDVLLGRPVRLDLDSLERKLVRERRGGYCFEHVTLFGAVLDALGFETTRHLARVVLYVARDASPLTHMFLTVTLPQGRFVVDPGFGGPAATVPIPLAEGAPGSGRSHWMAREGELWVLRTERHGEARDTWVSMLGQDHPIDFEMASHFTATHPSSKFTDDVMMSRFTADGRVSVLNRDVRVGRGTRIDASRLADRQALRALLRERFGFDLPDVERMAVPAIPEWR